MVISCDCKQMYMLRRLGPEAGGLRQPPPSEPAGAGSPDCGGSGGILRVL